MNKILLPPGFVLYTAKSRPDLYAIASTPSHPLATAWPKYTTSCAASKKYWQFLDSIPYFSQFQFMITAQSPQSSSNTNHQTKEVVVALANSIPFYWADAKSSSGDSSSLPDEGWEAALEQGTLGYFPEDRIPKDIEQKEVKRGEPRVEPNTLSALGITVDPSYRRQQLADFLLQQLKDIAQECKFDAMVVPLRPTRKHEFPFVEMEAYVGWKKDCPGVEGKEADGEVFDPWLRKHVNMGGKVIKVAPMSTIVSVNANTWRKWTGIDVLKVVEEKREKGEVKVHRSNKEFVEFLVEGGLVPVRYFLVEDRGFYIEPNVWVRHF